MPVKRTRRASPTPSGPTAGERLKRAKLAGEDFSNWGWVGTEVTDASQITQEHRLATCGLSRYSTYPFCANKYAKSETKQAPPTAGELEDDIIVISDDDSTTCSPKGCKSNPNCLNYLGQNKWESEDKALTAYMKVANLGENPLLNARDPETPAGLKNLGATCYANAFLQVWFQDLPFRRGVYLCVPSSKEEEKFEESPIFQLQVTFAAMQESIQSAFNPIKLVESLKLRSTEQQDAQEFSKLFMAHLDTEFQKQTAPGLRSLLADQFQGKQVYGTECSACHTKSERESEFLEIEVNLPKNSNLEDRIAASLESEELSGDNKYLCSVCDQLRDAKRYTELRQLPPVLHISVLRFVFDVSSLERKKSKYSITFPLTLDMDQFLDSRRYEQTADNKSLSREKNLYELRGILLHKGPSAYHGHYEAQVYDVKSESWYQFNDEVVTKIPSLVPKTNTETNGSKAKKPAAATKDRSRPKKRARIEDSDVDILDGPTSSSSNENHNRSSKSSASVSSKDAYMLVYARVPMAKETSSAEERSTSTDIVPPPRALQVVNKLNAEFDEACDQYATREKEVQEEFGKKRRLVMDLYKSWSLSSYDEDAGIVARQALESWLKHPLTGRQDASHEAAEESADSSTAHEPPPQGSEYSFENIDITCPHGKLDPSKSSNMKRVRQSALDRIAYEGHAKFIPLLKPSDVCQECVEAAFNERLYQLQHPKDVARFSEVDYIETGGQGYWVSKAWLKDWKLAKPRMHKPSQPDPPPDDPDYIEDVKCEHGGLITNPSPRRRISVAAYRVLKDIFPSLDIPAASHEICAVCEALVQISKEDKREIRKQAEDEKAKLKFMYDYGASSLPNMLDGPCAIVPERFIRSWRQWLLRPTDTPRPDIVDNTRFLCHHGLLSFDPNVEGDIDGVAYVRRSDWDTLEDLYSGGPLIALENVGEAWIPELSICEECRKERKSTFDTTDVTIHLLRPSDTVPVDEPRQHEPPSDSTEFVISKLPIRTYGSRSISGIRQSKRIRQAKKQERQCRVTISRSMTVKELKLKVQEEFDIPAIYQRLYFRGKELDDNTTEVVVLGVISNDTLYLKEDAEDVDMLGSDQEDEARGRTSDEGQGFGGTLLSGLPKTEPQPIVRSCSTCTFDNPPNALVCEMCDTQFT